MPFRDLATSIPRKYLSFPRFFISNSFWVDECITIQNLAIVVVTSSRMLVIQVVCSFITSSSLWIEMDYVSSIGYLSCMFMTCTLIVIVHHRLGSLQTIYHIRDRLANCVSWMVDVGYGWWFKVRPWVLHLEGWSRPTLKPICLTLGFSSSWVVNHSNLIYSVVFLNLQILQFILNKRKTKQQ